MATRRYWEVGLWTLAIGISLVANVGVVFYDLTRAGVPFRLWEPVVWEGTSHVVLGLLIPLILYFDRLVPIGADNWRRALAAHVGFSVVFALAHVMLMFLARDALYRIIGDGQRYDWGNWWSEFGYEYLKDFRAYALLLAMIYLYRFILRRLQGEAGFVTEGPEDADTVAVTDRFLIKKLGREFLVRVNDIDWVEAAGNYVNLHVGARVYPLRETMTGITERLAPQGFQRVHRSAIVNLDRVAEIVPFDTGDGEARLTTGTAVPVSRRYRKEIRGQFT